MDQRALEQAAGAMRGGDLGTAESVLRRALRKAPGHAQGNAMLGQVLAATGNLGQAEYFLGRAVDAGAPGQVLGLLRDVLLGQGKHEECRRVLGKALRRHPGDVGLTVEYGRACAMCGELDAALTAHREAHGAKPERYDALAALATTLSMAGLYDELFATVDAVRRRFGASAEVQSLLMMPLHYWEGADPKKVFDEHVLMGRLMGERFPADPRAHENVADPGRVLKVGYVSQDFRDRSAGHFIDGIVGAHDASQVEVFLYSSTPEEDGLTRRVREAATSWVDITRMDDRQAADRVRADGVDILVDLTGHTGGNRLGVLCFRPAPVQATYMGYPNTTGLGTVDYRMVDALTDPPGVGDALATETLVRLEGCFLCYAPPEAPEVAQRDGSTPLTFGSFNTHSKVAPTVLETWARVLAAVPDSRLVIKNHQLGMGWVADQTRGRLVELGVDPKRVELRGQTASKLDHMGAYADIDIALDTFPYNGTTTTVEAMWMGVPVVGLEGDSHVSRVGVSLLHAVGLGDLVAGSLDAYVEIAAGLAGDAARRGALRGELRERVRGAMCDAPAFTGRLEEVYRGWWRTWCEGRS